MRPDVCKRGLGLDISLKPEARDDGRKERWSVGGNSGRKWKTKCVGRRNGVQIKVIKKTHTIQKIEGDRKRKLWIHVEPKLRKWIRSACNLKNT